MANDQLLFEKVVFSLDPNRAPKGVDEWGAIVSYAIEGIVIKLSLLVFTGERYFKPVPIVFHQLKSDAPAKKGSYADLPPEIGACKA